MIGTDVLTTIGKAQRNSLLKSRLAAIRQDVRSPLYRNAYALMLNTGLTSILGFAYWALAAQLYDVKAVGSGAAVVTTMMLISVLTQLSFVQVLIRFIPKAGTQTRRLVLTAYATAATFSASVATIVVLLFSAFGSDNSDIKLTTGAGIWFVIATTAWSIFNLQDGALTGLRRTVWIPLENGLFGVVKIALLVLLQPALGDNGIFLSWTIPVLVSIFPVNFLILKRFVPAHIDASADQQPIDKRVVAKFMAGDYSGSLSVQLATTLLPILVVSSLGSISNGYFYMAQIMSTAIDLVAINLAASLTVEASNQEDKLAQLTRAVLGRTLKIVVPAALVLFVSAPVILGIFDKQYAEHSATLLRLLVLASIPKAITSVYGSLCRVQHKTHRNGVVQFIQASILIVLSLVLMPRIGVNGVGVAALIGQSTVALFVIPSLFKAIRSRNEQTDSIEPSMTQILQTTPSDSALEISGEAAASPMTSAVAPVAPPTIPSVFATPGMEGKRRSVLSTAIGVLIPVVILLGGLWSVRNVDAHNSGAFGLIEALPKTFFVFTGLMCVSFLLQVRAAARNIVLLTHVAAMIFLLHGVAGFIEGVPRFSTAYAHLGFINVITTHNAAVPSLDARMSWPAFFATGSILNKVAGVPDAYPFLLWASVFNNLVYAPLVWSIARSASQDRRVPWIATWIFVSVNWVGQDYFAPQATAYVLFLAITAVALRTFRDDTGRLHGILGLIGSHIADAARWLLRIPTVVPGGSPNIETNPRQRVAIVFALIVMFLASVAGHQLTPTFLLVTMGALALLRRTKLTGLPLLMIVIFFAWISYAAIGFWSGHIDSLFGGLGQVSGIVNQNVEARTTAVTGHHVYVIYGRLALSAFIWVLADIGFYRRLRSGRSDFSLIVCMFAQFLILGGQSYGGEAILRIFLFSLPFAATFGALALLPKENRLTIFKTALACIVAIALVPTFIFTRYGNEQFEYVSRGDYNAVKFMYKVAPENSTIAIFDPNTPVGVRDHDKYQFQNLKYNAEPATLLADLQKHKDKGSYVYISRGEAQSLMTTEGVPESWPKDTIAKMVDSGYFKVIYQNSDAAILQAVKK